MSETKTPWLFGGGAWLYDFLVRAMFLGSELRCRRLALLAIGAAQPQRMIELGVGTGRNFPLYPTGTLCIGVDRSEAMLARAQRRLAAMNAANIQVRRADARELPFPASAFDAALLFLFCSQRLPHRRIFAELDRVLVPGAAVVIVDHLRATGRLGKATESALDVLLRPFGFALRVDVLSLAADVGWRVRDVTPCPGTLSFLKMVTAEKGE